LIKWIKRSETMLLETITVKSKTSDNSASEFAHTDISVLLPIS
jgi:hypothetical protein